MSGAESLEDCAPGLVPSWDGQKHEVREHSPRGTMLLGLSLAGAEQWRHLQQQ